MKRALSPGAADRTCPYGAEPRCRRAHALSLLPYP